MALIDDVRPQARRDHLAMPSIREFFLNKPDTAATRPDQVEAPAFSLTKVLSTAAIVLTPLTTALLRYIEAIEFSPWQIVALILGVLGFVAITASADVLARARAAEGVARAGSQVYAELDPPLRATLVLSAEDSQVDVLAARRGHAGSRFLVREEGKPSTWVQQSRLRF